MHLRRSRSESIDLDAYEIAFGELVAIRDAHLTCTESPLDCRAGILWATNTTVLNSDADIDPGTRRSLLLDHAAEVNELLTERSSGRVGGLFVSGTRLQVATPLRSF